MKLLLGLAIVITLTTNCKTYHSEAIAKEYSENADSIEKGNKLEHYFFKEISAIYVADFDYYSKVNKLLSIKGYLLNKNYGCNFFFFSNGNLNDFMYNIGDDKHNSYNIKYKHKLYFEEGTPLADVWKKECDKKIDSIECFEVHFSFFPRKTLNVQISIDGINYRTLKLEESKYLPFTAKTELQVSRKENPLIFFIIDAKDPIIKLNGLESKKLFYDTLNRIISE